jgi:hypothetical protein
MNPDFVRQRSSQILRDAEEKNRQSNDLSSMQNAPSINANKQEGHMKRKGKKSKPLSVVKAESNLNKLFRRPR